MCDRLLAGKIALVTGATRSVGKGIAYEFARHGAHVLINGRDNKTIHSIIRDWSKQGLSVEAARADISDPAAMKSIIDNAVSYHGSLDVLVNNAVVHIQKGERGPFLSMLAEGWQEFMAKNLDALFFTTQYAARVMANKRRGSIINISSNGAVQAHRQRIAYDSFKGALESFTRAVAVDLAPWNIRVNTIRPCAVWEQPPPGSEREALEIRLGAMVPMGRIARPTDVAWAAVFLASDKSEYITGQCLNVDGGMLEQSRPPELELEPVVGPDSLNL
ncbi:MAG: SDR family oxidoreductase [Spirochaetaceae bacterium]|nr:MAG: SDR family oxidoreductase [Spirochaetaceae bacterium]